MFDFIESDFVTLHDILNKHHMNADDLGLLWGFRKGCKKSAEEIAMLPKQTVESRLQGANVVLQEVLKKAEEDRERGQIGKFDSRHPFAQFKN